jgi:three-Cys-motif partner protein
MLNAYLQAWFPIIAKGFGARGLTYVDAFAGPGEYFGGEIGSPLIALQQARRPDVAGLGHPIRLLFIEDRKDRAGHLEQLIDARYPVETRPANWSVRTLQGRCQNHLVTGLRDIRSNKSPIFVNFDGWGVDTPMSLVRHVGEHLTPEVLITFQAQWFVRFVDRAEFTAGDEVFGGQDWRPIAAKGSPAEKKRGLIDLYSAKLATAKFPYSLVFEMVDEGGHELLLVYGTSGEKGLEKMKDAMWSVDKVYGQRFRDPRDINQLSFELGDEADTRLLKQQLLSALEDGPQSLDALKRFALLDTVFKGTHVPGAVDELEAQGKVECRRTRKHSDFIVALATPQLF